LITVVFESSLLAEIASDCACKSVIYTMTWFSSPVTGDRTAMMGWSATGTENGSVICVSWGPENVGGFSAKAAPCSSGLTPMNCSLELASIVIVSVLT